MKSGLENLVKIHLTTKRNRLFGAWRNLYLKILQSAEGHVEHSADRTVSNLQLPGKPSPDWAPRLQPELLNHFFHSCDAGWTRHGALERMGDPRAVGRSAVGPLGQSVGLGLRLGTLSLKFPVLYPTNWFVFILGVRLCIQLSDLVLSIMHWCLLNIFRFIHIYKWKAYLFWGVWILFISYSSKRKWWFVRIQTF